MQTKLKNLFLLATGVLFVLSACNDMTSQPVTPDAESAAFMAVNISSPDGYIAYMGAFAEVPTTIDKTKLVEFGKDAHVSLPYGGNIFTFSSTTKSLSKWEVDKALNFSKTATIGLSDKGLPSYPAIAIQSATRGFILDLNRGKVFEFNPTAMTLTVTIDVTPTEKPFAYVGYLPSVYGNKIVANLHETDWDNQKLTERVAVAVFDVTTGQVSYHYDSRSTSGYEYFLDSKGYYYALPDMWSSAFMRNFGDSKNAKATGLVRFNVNTNSFDAGYFWPIEEILNGYTVNFYPISDTKAFVSYIPKPLSGNVTKDNIWTEGKARVKMFDLVTGKASDIPGLTGEYNSNTAGEGRYNYDGALYVPMNTRVGDNNAVRLYKITEQGATVHTEYSNIWISEISKLR